MNLRKIIFLTLFFSTRLVHAQIIDEVRQKYSANVGLKLYEILSKVELPPSQQIRVANYLKRQDSLIALAFKSDTSISTIVRKSAINPDSVRNILTPLEWSDYTSTVPKSLISYALKLRGRLGLKSIQVDSLLSRDTWLEKLRAEKRAKNDYEETRKVQVQVLQKILTNTQYNKFLEYKNEQTAERLTREDWDKLSKFGLIKNGDTLDTRKQIFDYKTRSLVINEKSLTDKSSNLITERNKNENNKPLILKELDAAIKADAAEKRVKSAFSW